MAIVSSAELKAIDDAKIKLLNKLKADKKINYYEYDLLTDSKEREAPGFGFHKRLPNELII